MNPRLSAHPLFFRFCQIRARGCPQGVQKLWLGSEARRLRRRVLSDEGLHANVHLRTKAAGEILEQVRLFDIRYARELVFSDFDYVEMVCDTSRAARTISFETDPYVIIRPRAAGRKPEFLSARTPVASAGPLLKELPHEPGHLSQGFVRCVGRALPRSDRHAAEYVTGSALWPCRTPISRSRTAAPRSPTRDRTDFRWHFSASSAVPPISIAPRHSADGSRDSNQRALIWSSTRESVLLLQRAVCPIHGRLWRSFRSRGICWRDRVPLHRD